MQNKKIVVGDYTDEQTGIRFVEDIRGNFHCIPSSGGSDEYNVTNNYETNNYNTVVQPAGEITNLNAVILQSSIISFTWGSITLFNRINNSYIPGAFLTYTVPFGKQLHILSITATQYKSGSSGISYVGLYRNGNLLLALPLQSELDCGFESHLVLPASSFVELKFLPYNNKIDLGICMLGYTV